MNRREAFQRIALVLGGVAIAPELLARALSAPAGDSAERLVLLDELSETILPATDTPGAKAAYVGVFVVQAVDYCLPEKHKNLFWAELDKAEALCKQQTGKSFVDCSPEERNAFFPQLKSIKRAQNEAPGFPPFFNALKMLVLHGYFSSEIGATQALNYDPVPGGWVPDMLIDSQTKAWTSVF